MGFLGNLESSGGIRKLILELFPRAGLKTGTRECEDTRNKDSIRKRSRAQELGFMSSVC